MSLMQRVRQWARIIATDVVALYLAARDVRTPRTAKAVALAVTAYALSPIDLIPDVIPILGLLDDAVILPLGIMLAVRMVGREVMADCRARAADMDRLPTSRTGAALIVGLWIMAVAAALWWLAPVLGYGA